jgi:hypothetical protein
LFLPLVVIGINQCEIEMYFWMILLFGKTKIQRRVRCGIYVCHVNSVLFLMVRMIPDFQYFLEMNFVWKRSIIVQSVHQLFHMNLTQFEHMIDVFLVHLRNKKVMCVFIIWVSFVCFTPPIDLFGTFFNIFFHLTEYDTRACWSWSAARRCFLGMMIQGSETHVWEADKR